MNYGGGGGESSDGFWRVESNNLGTIIQILDWVNVKYTL